MLAFPLAVALNTVGALVAGPSTARRTLAVTLSLLAFGVCLALPDPYPMVRVWTWLGAFMLFMRMCDVVSETKAELPTRLALLLTILDPRELRPAPPRLDVRLLGKGLAFAVVAIAAIVLAAFAPNEPARWLAGGVFFYCGMETVGAAFVPLFAAAGMASGPLQDHPILSRSLTEFWGRRWNRVVGRWLHHWCFRPLARRGLPKLGLALAFAWSGFFHAVATWAAADLTQAGWMLAFFLAQGLLVAVERALRVSRWPAWAAHTWVLACFVVTGPLFVEPGLRVMGLSPAP